jgi:hypothetical protein
MIKEYTHELEKEVLSISGRYELVKEERFEYNKKEIIYVIGNAIVDSSCCGHGGCRYAVVPGYIVSWKSKINEDGLHISQVEPITEQFVKKDLRRVLEKKEWVSQVQFW